VNPTTTPPVTPAPNNGNPAGRAVLPAEAQQVDTAHPARVIGTGTAASCTSAAVVSAVAAGGITTFNCGADPVTIVMTATAKVHNDTGRTVLDGGGKVTLSGGGARRILYMNTCDSSLGRSRSDCLYQTDTQLVVQNLTFVDGNSTGDMTEGGGGGAIFVRGGRLKVVNSRFQRNRCDRTGPDLGGAAIRITIQYHSKPNYIVNSTFGGAQGQGGSCSNGGAISGLHASLAVYNSLLTYNTAIGNGANPARSGTPGGGSGGAIYTDGDRFTVGVYGSVITDNHAREGGGAILSLSRLTFRRWWVLDKVVIGTKSLRHKVIVCGVTRTIFTGRFGHGVVTVVAGPNGSRMRRAVAPPGQSSLGAPTSADHHR
jgi:hypothetical protein